MVGVGWITCPTTTTMVVKFHFLPLMTHCNGFRHRWRTLVIDGTPENVAWCHDDAPSKFQLLTPTLECSASHLPGRAKKCGGCGWVWVVVGVYQSALHLLYSSWYFWPNFISGQNFPKNFHFFYMTCSFALRCCCANGILLLNVHVCMYVQCTVLKFNLVLENVGVLNLINLCNSCTAVVSRFTLISTQHPSKHLPSLPSRL